MVKTADKAPPALADAGVEWRVTGGLTDYAAACRFMEERVAGIVAGSERELVWLVEHPPIYTAGTSADARDLLAPDRFPVHRTGRGGQYTYHGPGQRVGYVMLDVGRRFGDVRAFVNALEEWLIVTLATFGIRGERREGRVGIWIDRPERGPGAEDKIAALGVRLRRWVSFHGVSLNVAPDLEHFSGIVACGVSGHGQTSIADLGKPATFTEVDAALRRSFEQVFGPLDRPTGRPRPSGAG